MKPMRWTALLALCAMLAACATTTQQTVNGRVSLPQSIPATEGVVVLKLVGMKAPSVMNTKFRTLTISSVASGARIDIHDVSPLGAADSVFAGSLPPGRYEIVDLAAWGNAPGLLLLLTVSDFKDARNVLPAFTVEAGALTNLGTVAIGPDEEKKGMAVAIFADERGRADAIRGLDAASRQRVAGLRSLPWAGVPATNSADAEAFVRRLARNISSPDLGPGGEVVIGGPLGLVHTLGADRQWRSESMGSLDAIVYVCALPDGRVVAGTDDSRYFLRSPQTGKWTEHALPVERATLLQVEPMGAAGYALRLGFMSAPQFAGPGRTVIAIVPDLEQVAGYAQVLSLEGSSAYGQIPMYFDGRDLRVAFSHTGISRTADLYRIDPSTRKVSSEKVDSWVIGAYRLADGTQVMHRMNGMSDYPALSRDGGKTWTRRDTEAPFAARFVSGDLGYGMVTVTTGWSTVTAALSKTADGGVSWKRSGETFESGGRVAILRRPGGELVVMTNGMLLATPDEGARWQTLWPLPR